MPVEKPSDRDEPVQTPPVEDDVPQELKDEAAQEAEYPPDETDEG